jgi:hypothetical protein
MIGSAQHARDFEWQMTLPKANRKESKLKSSDRPKHQ